MLVQDVVKNDGENQAADEKLVDGSQSGENGDARDGFREANSPSRPMRYLPRWDGAVGRVFLIPFRIEGVVHRHAAQVEQADASNDPAEFSGPPASAEKPADGDIGPDGGEVGDAAEDEERSQRTHEGKGRSMAQESMRFSGKEGT